MILQFYLISDAIENIIAENVNMLEVFARKLITCIRAHSVEVPINFIEAVFRIFCFKTSGELTNHRYKALVLVTSQFQSSLIFCSKTVTYTNCNNLTPEFKHLLSLLRLIVVHKVFLYARKYDQLLHQKWVKEINLS